MYGWVSLGKQGSATIYGGHYTTSKEVSVYVWAVAEGSVSSGSEESHHTPTAATNTTGR